MCKIMSVTNHDYVGASAEIIVVAWTHVKGVRWGKLVKMRAKLDS